MKIFVTLAPALLLSPACVAVEAKMSEKLSALSTFVIPSTDHGGSHRKLLEGLSAQCEDAIDALFADPAVKASNSLKEAQAANVDVSQICNGDEDELTCTYDLINLPSHDQYENACEDANGRLVDFDFGLVCDEDGIRIRIFVSDDVCLPLSCSGDEWSAYVENAEDEIQRELTSAFAGTDGSCTILLDTSNDTSSTISSNAGPLHVGYPRVVFGMSVFASFALALMAGDVFGI